MSWSASTHALSLHHSIQQQTYINHALKLFEPVIVAAIKSFQAGSIGGLDGLRPQHLKT